MKNVLLVMIFLLFSSSLNAQQAVKAVYFNNFPPFSWEKEGEMKGIFIDVLNEIITKNMGIPVTHKGYPWARAQMYVRLGEDDAFVTVPTPERRVFTEISKESVIISKISIFTKAGHPRFEEMKNIKTIEDFKNFTLITYIGDGYSKKLFQGWDNVMWVPTLDKCLDIVKEGRYDIFFRHLKSQISELKL